MPGQRVIERCCENVRRGGHDVRINPSDRKTCPHNAASGVQTGSCRAQGGSRQRREGKSKRRFAASTLNKDRAIARCICGEKRGKNQTRGIAAEFFLDVSGSEPIRIHSESAA